MRKLFDWIYRLVMGRMAKQQPMQTTAEESEKVLEQMEEYKKMAADRQDQNNQHNEV